MKDSFVFYRSFYESTKNLSSESRLRLFDNICELALNGKDIDGLKGIEQNIFTLIRPQIEANNQRYENGKKGGRPNKKTIGYLETKTTGFENKKPNVNENVNVNDNENVYIEKIKRFKPPTLSEIEEYCKERNNNVNAKRFFDYYETANWKDSKGTPVKNWKQKMIANWESKAKSEETEQPLPKWFNQEFKEKEMDDERKRELEELIRGY